ncbi:MAG: 50S ribosomal protein L34e [Candidatus Hodarchaeales archaeon]|jgi:large subunit ribosomal protein L34e
MRVKSKARRKKFIRTPGGKVQIHHVKRPKAPLGCVSCGVTLNGVKNLRVSQMRKLSKTEKVRNQIKYKDTCPSCRDKLLKEKVMTKYTSG